MPQLPPEKWETLLYGAMALVVLIVILMVFSAS